jgi:hypothetical protein
VRRNLSSGIRLLTRTSFVGQRIDAERGEERYVVSPSINVRERTHRVRNKNIKHDRGIHCLG